MKIAIVTEVFMPKVDGITNRLDQTIRCLAAEGHEVLVVAPSGSVREHAGARVVGIPGVPFAPYPGLQVSLPDPRIAWELARFAPDVVHVVGPACLGLWATLAARALGLPIVASYHTDFPRYLPGYGLEWAAPIVWPTLRAVHNAAHVNLCPSRFTRDELIEHGIRDVDLWRGGVDTRRFAPSKRSLEMRMRMSDGRPDGPIVLYVGRVSPEKQIGRLQEVLDAVPEVRLCIVGDGPARETLEGELDAHRTRFLGFLRGEALARAFASADLFVMPSTTETLGFVVLEAMSSGTPVLAADAGGIPDLVRHGENGWLVDPEIPGAYGRAARTLLMHEAQRTHLARQGRKLAEEASWEAETRRLVQQYRKTIVIAQRPGLIGRLARLVV